MVHISAKFSAEDVGLVIRYWEPGTGGDLTSFLTHPPAPSLPRPSGTWQRWGVSWFNSNLMATYPSVEGAP